MDIDALKIYQAVVRSGSFSAVARERELAASSIARVVSQLESQLGVRLLQRSTRKLGLTESGQLFFDRITPLLEELDRTQSELKDLSSNPKGKLRITASPSFGSVSLAPALVEFEGLYPDLKIDLVLSDKLIDLVEDSFDLAIRQGPLMDSSLVAQRLLTVRYRVCASPLYLQTHGRPQHPSDLTQHRCLVFSLANFRHSWKFKRGSEKELEVTINNVMQVNNGMVLRQWALANAGVVMLSDWLIGKDIVSGDLVDVFPDYEATATEFNPKVWLVYPSRAYVPEKVSLLASFLKNYFSTFLNA